MNVLGGVTFFLVVAVVVGLVVLAIVFTRLHNTQNALEDKQWHLERAAKALRASQERAAKAMRASQEESQWRAERAERANNALRISQEESQWRAENAERALAQSSESAVRALGRQAERIKQEVMDYSSARERSSVRIDAHAQLTTV